MAAATGKAKKWGAHEEEGENEGEDVFEVECVRKHSVCDNGAVMYLLKWKGYPDKDNTWEFEMDTACPDVILAYWKKQNAVIWRARRVMRACMGKNLVWTIRDVSKEIALITKHLDDVTYEWQEMANVNERNRMMKQLQTEMNTRLRARGEAAIRVCNDVDLVVPPTADRFIHERLIAANLVTKVKKLHACLCVNESACGISSECCVKRKDSRLAYTREGLLAFPDQMRPIYECSASCECPDECGNRVAQKGRQFEVELTRSDEGFWFLRPTVDLDPGTFVGEILGEVITLAEAERRYMQYGSVLTSRTVIEIAYGDSDPKYSIDRTKYFDLSRFIQHSCEPNVCLHLMYTGEEEESLPHLVLFTKSRIPKLTPLTLDFHPFYSNVYTEDDIAKLHSNGIDHVRCKCGSENDKCRNLLWYRGIPV